MERSSTWCTLAWCWSNSRLTKLLLHTPQVKPDSPATELENITLSPLYSVTACTVGDQVVITDISWYPFERENPGNNLSLHWLIFRILPAEIEYFHSAQIKQWESYEIWTSDPLYWPTVQWGEDDNFPLVTSWGDLILEENEMMTLTLSHHDTQTSSRLQSTFLYHLTPPRHWGLKYHKNTICPNFWYFPSK